MEITPDLKQDFQDIYYMYENSKILHTICQKSKALSMWSMSQIWLRGKYISSKRKFFAWSEMSLILEQESFFKVTAYVLSKSILWQKYEPDLTKGRKSGRGVLLCFCYDVKLSPTNLVQCNCKSFTKGTLWVKYEQIGPRREKKSDLGRTDGLRNAGKEVVLGAEL